jgi:hypothetical protein
LTAATSRRWRSHGSADRSPGIPLALAVGFLLVRMPADRRQVEEDLGAAQRRQPRALRIPLIPADQGADPSRGRVERAKPEIARSEIELS